MLGVGTAFFYGFGQVNNIFYKLIVDKSIIGEARKMGYDEHVQPNGTFKNRGLNFWDFGASMIGRVTGHLEVTGKW